MCHYALNQKIWMAYKVEYDNDFEIFSKNTMFRAEFNFPSVQE